MIVIKTPLRVSLAGGGSDLASYYRNAKYGAVVSYAINKYVYICVNKRFDDRIRVSYSKTEIVSHPDELEHELARACLQRMGIYKGIEIVSISDIPGEGTGLGSSSAYVVGLLSALTQYRQLYGGLSAEYIFGDVAEEACRIEIEVCGKPIGKQDQYACAYGGMNYIKFMPDDSVVLTPINLNTGFKQLLESHMMLFYTGTARSSTPILTQQNRNTKEGKNKEQLDEMVEIAKRQAGALMVGDLKTLGSDIHAGWALKRQLASGIATSQLNDYVNIALRAGAEGVKISGAGGGGFMTVFAKPIHHQTIKNELPLQFVPFEIEPRGTRIAYMTTFKE